MGHLISHYRVSIDPSKIKAIVGWPRPTTILELKSFLECSGYYRRFAMDFSSSAAPLTKLMCKEEKFVWKEDCEKGFQKLKKRLTCTPILILPSRSGGFVIYSLHGLGCMLMQHEKVDAYTFHSRLGIGSGCICLENMETLLTWGKI